MNKAGPGKTAGRISAELEMLAAMRVGLYGEKRAADIIAKILAMPKIRGEAA